MPFIWRGWESNPRCSDSEVDAILLELPGAISCLGNYISANRIIAKSASTVNRILSIGKFVVITGASSAFTVNRILSIGTCSFVVNTGARPAFTVNRIFSIYNFVVITEARSAFTVNRTLSIDSSVVITSARSAFTVNRTFRFDSSVVIGLIWKVHFFKYV